MIPTPVKKAINKLLALTILLTGGDELYSQYQRLMMGPATELQEGRVIPVELSSDIKIDKVRVGDPIKFTSIMIPRAMFSSDEADLPVGTILIARITRVVESRTHRMAYFKLHELVMPNGVRVPLTGVITDADATSEPSSFWQGSEWISMGVAVGFMGGSAASVLTGGGAGFLLARSISRWSRPPEGYLQGDLPKGVGKGVRLSREHAIPLNKPAGKRRS
ncbi:MAG: hypothetical protein LC778_20710 [Acidobacteria bacterium]|nr:hypothetical protein [Acidobacteriota bacterium]